MANKNIDPWFNNVAYDYKDKNTANLNYINQFLCRTQTMFKYNNLPDTIPQRILELTIQTKGHCGIVKKDDDIYVVWGMRGGEKDLYYQPVNYIVSNAYSDELTDTYNIFYGYGKIKENSVILIPNNSLYLSLVPLINRYTSLLTENDLSILMCCINTRIYSLVSAGDDKSRESAESYLKKVIAGDIGIIADSKMLDSIKTQPYGNTNGNTITQLIENQQYLKASLYNELGIQSNYNMKRESINSNEAQLNDEALKPFITDMLINRQNAIKLINENFGTNITVELSDCWEKEEYKEDNSQESIEENTQESGEDNADNRTIESEE